MSASAPQTFASPAAKPRPGLLATLRARLTASGARVGKTADDPIAELDRLTAEIERDARFFGLLFLITAVGIAAAGAAGVWQ